MGMNGDSEENYVHFHVVAQYTLVELVLADDP